MVSVSILKATQQGQRCYGVDADWVVLGGGARWRHIKGKR